MGWLFWLSHYIYIYINLIHAIELYVLRLLEAPPTYTDMT